MPLSNVSSTTRSVRSIDSENSVQAQNILAEDISEVRNTESNFLQRLRNFRARAMNALSTVWQLIRNNVLRCCSSDANDDEFDNILETSTSNERARTIYYDPNLEIERIPTHLAALEPFSLNLPSELMDADTTAIVGFLCDQRTTTDGLRFSDIIKWSSQELSMDHEYFSYLFPSHEMSDLAPAAALANLNTREIFLLNRQLRNLYMQGVIKMLGHWQLRLNANELVERASNFNPERNLCLKVNNYNRVLVYKMMQSLSMLGFNRVAKSLQSVMLTAANDYNVAENIKILWQDALQNIPQQ